MGLNCQPRGLLARAHRVGAAGLVLTAFAVPLASCGSSSSSSPATGTSASSSSSSGSSPALAAAQKIVDSAKNPSTDLGVTEPLKSKPAPGKTVVWLNCDFTQCDDTGKAMAEAVKTVGWNLKMVQYKSANPATLVSAFKQALQYNPVGVALSGVPKAAWASVIPLYKKAGVPIVEGLVGPQAVDGTVIANLFNDQDLAKDAEILANWMAVDSKGKGKAVVMGVPDFPILGGFSSAFTAALKKACPGCSASTVNATIAQIGNPSTANGLLVSGLQKDPSIKYVITCDGALNPGLAAALSGAGLSGLKIGGALGTAENATQILAGKEHAFTGQNIGYYGWQLLDSVLRKSQGMQIEAGNGGQPHQLLTKDNVGTPSNDLKYPVDYQAKYTKLWNAA